MLSEPFLESKDCDHIDNDGTNDIETGAKWLIDARSVGTSGDGEKRVDTEVENNGSKKVIRFDGHLGSAGSEECGSRELSEANHTGSYVSKVVGVEMRKHKDECADGYSRCVVSATFVAPTYEGEEKCDTEQCLFEDGYFDVAGNVVWDVDDSCDGRVGVQRKTNYQQCDGTDDDCLEDARKLVVCFLEGITGWNNHIDGTHRVKCNDAANDNEDGLNGLCNGVCGGDGQYCASSYQSDDGEKCSSNRLRSGEIVGGHCFVPFPVMSFFVKDIRFSSFLP